jgi:hypothetical protein
MRKPRVAVITSRRKATNARKSETIAAMKSTVMSLDRLTGKKCRKECRYRDADQQGANGAENDRKVY